MAPAPDSTPALGPVPVAEHIARARAARAAGSRQEALTWFKAALRQKPDHPSLPVEVARELSELDNLDEAETVLRELLARQPDSAPARMGMGLLARKREQPEKALIWYEEALSLAPEHPTVPVELARVLFELNRLDEAASLLESLLSRRPDAFHAWLILGRIARQQDRHDHALSCFQSAWALQPQHHQLPLDIATELRALGRQGEAERLLHDEHPRQSARLWHLRGLLAQDRNDAEEALRCFAQGQCCQPEQPACYQAMLAEYLRLCRLDEADALLTRACQAAPDPRRWATFRIRLLRARGELEAAMDLAGTTLVRWPGDAELITLSVTLLIGVARFEEAHEVLAGLAASDDARRQQGAYLRALVARARYDLDAALHHGEAALAFDRQNPKILQELALILLMRGNSRAGGACLDDARRVLERHGSARVRASSGGGLRRALFLELRTNPFAEQALALAWNAAAAERAAAMMAILAEEPAHLGTAMSLLITLRHSGVFDHPAPVDRAVESPIPRCIVQFWDSAEVPPDIADTLSSWPRANPGFEYRLFNDGSAEAFIARHCEPDVLKAFRMANLPAMRADVFRLAFLLTQGGIYADADDLCRHGIDVWLEPGVELVLLQEDLGTIGNNFMAVAPGHPFIKAVLETVTANILGRQGSIWFASGPGAITLSFCAKYLPALREQRLPAGLCVIDYCHVQQRISLHLPRRYKQGDTHWSNPANGRHPTYRVPLPIRAAPPDGSD